MSEQKVKIIAKADVLKAPVAPEVITVTVEIPVTVDQRTGIRSEIAYLQTLMRRYPGPTTRFYKEMKFS